MSAQGRHGIVKPEPLAPTLIVVIPVFNESATIARVVETARAHGPVLVVDDGSIDDTAARAEAAGAEVIRHPRRLGKGQALRSGMAAAAIRGAGAVVTLDGDGQHDPREIGVLLRAAAADPGAIVIGGRLEQSRRLERGRVNAIRVAGFFMNWATGLRVEDTQSGFRLYPLTLVRGLHTRRGGFVFETEVLVVAARGGVAVREVAVSAIARTAHSSRFRPFLDGALIGAYLTGRGLARSLGEARAALGAVAAVTSRQRRASRHREMLVEASVYQDALGLWASALGASAARRAADRVATWWRHPRRRRATTVATGVALLPVVGALGLCQVVLDWFGRGRPDLVTPVVERWFSQARLVAVDADEARPSPSVAAASHARSLAAPPVLPS